MKASLMAACLAAIAFTPATAASTAEPVETSAQAAGVHLARMTLGYTYFNRPGAGLWAHNADVKACIAEAAKTRSIDDTYAEGQDMGIVGNFIRGKLGDAYWHGTVGAGLENCMVVRGWRVVHLPDADGQALSSLSPSELASRMGPWIGAAEPNGEVVRTWANEAANGAVPRFAIRPAHTNDGPLSLKLATDLSLDTVDRPEFEPPPSVKLDRAWPRKPLKPEQIASTTPEAAVFVVRVKGIGMRTGHSISFRRKGPDSATYASEVDRRPDLATFGAGVLFAKSGGNWHILPATPGRWRLNGLHGAGTVNLCLGSPSFEARAGDVIYLGTFDLGSSEMGPDLDLEPAKSFLAGQPAAEKIQAASYVNGSRGRCDGDTSIYALEIPGAPFETNYAWGSMSSQRPAQGHAASDPGAQGAQATIPTSDGRFAGYRLR